MEDFVKSKDFKYMLFILAFILIWVVVTEFDKQEDSGIAIGFCIVSGALFISFAIMWATERMKGE